MMRNHVWPKFVTVYSVCAGAAFGGLTAEDHQRARHYFEEAKAPVRPGRWSALGAASLRGDDFRRPDVAPSYGQSTRSAGLSSSLGRRIRRRRSA